MTKKILNIDSSELEKKYGISSPAAKLICAAGLNDEQIKDLLSHDTDILTSHSECVRKCCEILMECRKNNTKVFVGGDYDADGITSTAIMKDILDRLPFEVEI